METTKKLSLDDIFGKASAPASSEAVKSIDDIFGQKEAATPVAPYGTMTDEIRGVSHAPADLVGVSPQPAIIGENELQKNRADFEKELKSMAGAIQPTQDSFKPMSADAFKVGGDVTMPGAVDKPKSLSQTVQSEINKRWGGDLQSIIDKARSVNPENVNLAEDMESHFWKVMKDKVPSDSFITQEDLDGFKFTRDYSNGDKDIEYSFGHYTYPQEVVNEYVARHNDEVLHNMRFKEEPEYRNEWFLRNVGVTEQAYRDEVAADLENRLHELRKKIVATLPAQHTRGGYAAIGAAANKPSSGASVSIEKIDKALKTVNTLRKNSFGAGLKEGFDLADILTLGVSGIGENVALLNALNKSASGKTLTTSEQALVEAWDIQNEAEEVIDTLGGRKRGANIGYGVSQSLGFMTQTAGTGGVASFATKGIGRAAARVALRRATNMGVNKSIKEGLRYGGLKVAESAVGAAARTPFMGFTYQNYTDKRLNQFQVKERVDEATGEISKYIDKQEASALRDVAHAVLESYFENQSEDVGGLIDFGITSFARALPLKGLLRNRAAEALRGPVKNGAMKWIKEGVKLHSIIGEMLSEAYGDAMINLLTANNEGWKQMATSDYWWELLGVSSMLSGGFWVANKGVNFLAYKDERKAINKNLKQRKESLSRIEDDNLKKELTEATLTDDVIDRSKRLSSLDWSNYSREDMANAVDFIDAQTRLDVLREGATESRRLARIMPAIDEVKKLADSGALDDEQAAAHLATIYSDLFRTQENQRALNILTDRIKVAADAGISADEINEILRGAGLTVFNPGDEIETLTGDRAIVDKVLPGAYEIVNNEGDRAVVSFEEVLQNTPEVRQIQQESNQTEGQAESAPENNPQVEQAVADARAQVAEIINKDDNAVYEVETDDGITGYIIGGKGIVVDNDGRINQSAEDTVVVKTDEGNRVVHKERVKVKNRQTLQEIEDLARGAAEGALAAVQPQQPVGGKTYQGIYDNEQVTITLPREIKFNEDGTVDYDNLMNPETVSVIRPNGAVVDEVGLNEIEQLTEAEQVSADVPAVEQQEVTNLEPDFSAIRPVSIGDFGPIYDQFRGNAKDAIALLLQRKDGEAVGALSHPEVGEIDLVWGHEGTSKSDGYGLSKLAKYHPEVLENLQEILNDMKVASRTENRVQLESDTHKASVRLTWNEQKKNWLLTAFEKKEASASIGKTTDTDDNPKDLRGDTALSQNADALSDNKDTTFEPKNQEVAQKNVTEVTPVVQQPQIPLLKNGEPDYNAMDARMFAEQYVTRFGEGATERIARNNIKASNKTISTIEKQIEDVTDPNKMPALYLKLQEAQATKDKYSAVLEELGLSADESEDNAARIQRKKQENTPWFNKLFPDGFPNVESVILWDIANGNRIRWANKEVNGAVVSKGLGSHLGLADSNAERTRRVALIGKDAPTPEEYAEQLPERLNAMGIRFEESELLDKVLDVYASVDTVRKAKEELEKISANIQAEQEGLDYEEEQMRRNYEREQEALRQEAQADVVDEQTEQEQPTNEEIQEEELSIEDEVPFMVSSDSVQTTNEAQKLATEAAITALEDAGVEVVNATPEMVEEALRRNNAIWRKGKALETAEQSKKTTIPTAISSASSAKVIKNLDILATEYEERPSNRARTFLGDVSGALEIPKSDKKSRYKVFEAVNGVVFAIRLSDHNATVKNFDDHNEDYGISIVVTGKPNTKITNEGKANIVEFFYSEKELRKADGKPLAQIIRSIQQALFSGVYEDTTGLAEIEEVNDQFDIRAYHGSGSKFDAFDHSYMGTGEGTQAFGWGTYVSESDDVARTYAMISPNSIRYAQEKSRLRRKQSTILDKILTLKGDALKKAKAELEEIDRDIAALNQSPRQLYEVDIPDDNGQNYLHWDKEVSKEVLKDLQDKLNLPSTYFVSIYPQTGERVYKALSGLLGSDKVTSEFLNRNGYVGIQYPAQYPVSDRNDGLKNFVIFNPLDVKIVHTTQFSIGPAPVFVSNAKIAVLGIKQEKAMPEQWLKMIEKTGGLKAGEDKWIGLSDWLKASEKKTLTKQEVLGYINENQIQIEETTYSSNSAVETTPEFKALQKEFKQLVKSYEDEAQRNLDEYEAKLEKKYNFTDTFDTTVLNSDESKAHSSLSRAVGEAYSAAWVDLVDRYGDDFEIAFWRGHDGIRVDNAEAAGVLLGLPIDRPIYHLREDYTTKGLEGNREIALTVPTIEPWNENDEVHFGDAGEGRAIAWARFGETTDSDGKRVLVIDEIQSKRHQEGREKGYILAEDEELKSKQGAEIWVMMQKYNVSRPADLRGVVSAEDAARLDELARYKFGEVPEAPFEKNWAELAMKRMLRYAAENSFDKVAWTKGDQQAERYDIGSVVNRIESVDTVDYDSVLGVDLIKQVTLFPRDHSSAITLRLTPEGIIRASSMYNGEHIANIVGKEIGGRIMSDNNLILKGQDLRIGGEGMRAFYDQMLPSFMNKYGKKWGVKVQDVTLPYVEEAGRTMHSVDVTESMRESVMQGQPMFYRRPNGTVYGWTNGTTVYLTESGMNPNTPIHEYTHIWAAAMKKHNPEGWKSVVKLLKGTPVWNEVMDDTNYANIHSDEHKVASEALSRISGRENAAKMEAMAQQMIDENANDTVKKNRARKLLDRMRKALQEFWSWVGKELFGIKNFDSIEQVTDRILYDLVSGTDLISVSSFDTPAAEHAEEVTSEAQKIADKFGLSNEIVVAETQYDYIREIKSEGIRDEDINLDTYAVYMPSGRIIVNAEAADNMAELSDSIMHEFAHNVTRGGDMLYRLQDTVLEVGEERFEAAGREIFGQTTDPLVVADEIIATFVGNAANPTLYDGEDLVSRVFAGYSTEEAIRELLGSLPPDLYNGYADVVKAVMPYVKEVLDAIKTNHDGPRKRTRASEDYRDAQAKTGRVRISVQGYSGRSEAKVNRFDNEPDAMHATETSVHTKETFGPEGVNEFSIGNGEEIDRRTHSEGEFVLSATSLEDAGANLQPDAGVNGRGLPLRRGLLQSREGVPADAGGQLGGRPGADRADLANSQEQSASDQEDKLTPQEDKAKDKTLKQLDRLNKVINSLRQTVKQAERDNVDLANIVQAALEEEVKDGGINRFLDVPELISLIRSGMDKKSIESTMDRLSERLTDAIIKNREEQLAQLLQVQVQGTNAFGIPIGYAVDDDTRAMVEFFRENLSRDMNKIVEAMASEDDKSLKPYNKSELNVWFTAYKEIEESRYNIKATQKDIDHETERSQSFYRLTKELKAKNAPEGQIKTAQEHRRQALRNKKAQKKAILVAKQTLAQELEGMIFLLGGRLRDGRAIRAGRLSADKVYAKNFLTEAMADVRVNDGTKTFQGTKEELTAKAKFHKDIRVRTAAYRSYAYMIQSVSRNAIGGKGFLWDALMEGKNGWVDCNDKRLAMDNIDNQEILANVQASGLKSVADLQRLFDKQLVDKNGNPYVFRYETDRTGRIDQDIRPTIGWATYIVLCFEQDDMAPTMEKMRITEEQIQQIRDMLPEAAKNFLKWSRKMLEDRRQRIYNPASLERFGTQMANIPNYFPIRRLEKNLHKVEEVEQVASADSDQVTIMANALIKRVRNVVEIDFQQNPLELLKNHLERMNGFAANVPLARNVNILLNSSGFRDQLNEQGDPNTYEYFKTAAKVALSSYKPKPGALDSVMIELQGWLAAGKIAWRFFTALKQLLSLPAFWSYNVSLRYKAIFIRSVLWPTVKNGDEGKLVAIWKWGMDNIPQLKERWSSRYAGNEKLAQVKDTLFAQYIAKHALLRNTVGQIGEWGMIPNAAVDLFACSIGCYAVYKFELEQLQKKGYPKEEADELAKRRASIAFNESQQSSESAFIAPLQRDRTFLAVQVSLFNNSNFGYGRKEKLARKYLWQQTFNKDLREKRLALAKKRYLERFLNEERNRLVENNNKIADVTKRLRPEEIDRMVESKRAEFSKRAEKEANRDAKMAYAKGVEDAVMFKWLLNMAWQMAPTAVAYWLSCAMREGDDEDPQNPLNAETLALMFATATFRNAIGGGVFESALNGYGFTGLVGSEVEKTVDILAQALQPLWLTDEEAESFDPLAVWMAVKQCLVMGTGFDVNVFTNIFTGLVGLFNDRSRTTADVLRILNAPKSMIREIEIVPFEDETLDNYTRRMAMMENVALDRMEELKEKPSSELNATERRELRKMKKWEKNLITIRQAEAAGVPYSREVDGRVVAAELKQLDADYADLLKSLDLTQSGKNRAGKVELTEDERRRKKALRVVTRVKGIRKMEESAAEVINNPEAYRNAYRQIVEEKRTLIEEWNQ